MNIDFHTHVKLAKKTVFWPEYFQAMTAEAKRSGLDAIALTEHFNTLDFLAVYDYLDNHYDYEDHFYNVDGLRVFPGMEVDVQETGHILIISSRVRIRALFEKLRPHLEESHFVPFQTLMDWTSHTAYLKIGGHPFRPSTPLTQYPDHHLARLDAFDLNGKDLHSIGTKVNEKKVRDFAEKIGIPVVAGSDTHQFLQYGTVWNELDYDCRTVEEMRSLISLNKYCYHIHDQLPEKVHTASLTKKVMKSLLQQHTRTSVSQ